MVYSAPFPRHSLKGDSSLACDGLASSHAVQPVLLIQLFSANTNLDDDIQEPANIVSRPI